jgi:DNA helicase-2/ATP-dependent DNA helicase PcrA
MGGTSYFSLDSGRVASHEGELSLSMSDIGVLYRLNAQGNALEKALDRAGIPFVKSGEAPLTSQFPVNIIWRFLQTLQYPDNPYYANTYETLIKENGLAGKAAAPTLKDTHTLPELIDQVVASHNFDLSSEQPIEALRRLKQQVQDFEGELAVFLDALSLERGIDHGALAGERVALMSLHAAKGLEWPVVFISGCEDKLMPCSLFGSRDDDEERRLFYVGMTRAQKKLILSNASRRSLNGRILDMKPSPFLDVIPEELCSPLDRGGWKARKRAYKQLELF